MGKDLTYSNEASILIMHMKNAVLKDAPSKRSENTPASE